MYPYIFILLILSLSAQAQDVYKQIDDDGHVVYSSEPASKDQQPAQLKEISVVPTREVKARPDIAEPETTEEAGKVPDYELKLMKPEQDESIWASANMVEVELNVSPDLSDGHFFQIYLDQVLAFEGPATQHTFKDVYRGAHTLQAQIVDAQKNVIKQSPVVTFYIQQKALLITPPQQ